MPGQPHTTGVGNGPIRIDIGPALKKLAAIREVMEPATLLDAIGAAQQGWATRQAAAAGQFTGTGAAAKPWQRMAESTLKERRRKGKSAPSDNHFVSHYQQLLQQSVVWERHGEVEVEVGTALRYAVYHHYGAKRGNWALPARPTIPDNQQGYSIALHLMQAIEAKVSQMGRS